MNLEGRVGDDGDIAGSQQGEAEMAEALLRADGGDDLCGGVELDAPVAAVLEGELASVHFVIESIVFVGASIALVLNVRDLRRLRERLVWEERRNRGLSGALAEVIGEQMDEWGFTRSEKDVAWMIAKGYRFTEIAELRGVKESTPRLQATSVYSKAGVSGRAEFVAEILQPLLMTIPESSPPGNENRSVETEPS